MSSIAEGSIYREKRDQFMKEIMTYLKQELGDDFGFLSELVRPLAKYYARAKAVHLLGNDAEKVIAAECLKMSKEAMQKIINGAQAKLSTVLLDKLKTVLAGVARDMLLSAVGGK